MAAKGTAVYHVLPVVRHSPSSTSVAKIASTPPRSGQRRKPHLDRILQPIPLMHVTPWAAYAHHMHHTVEDAPIIMSGPRFTAAL